MTTVDPAELSVEEAWAKAKKACFDLLAVRQRSVDELRRALRRKGFDHELAERLLGKLAESGFLDDAAFAEEWVRSRHGHQGLGRKALVEELKNKGVDGDTAAHAVEQLDTGSEEQRARELVRKKLRTMRGVDGQAATRRLMAMLARKGYAEELAYSVVRDELELP